MILSLDVMLPINLDSTVIHVHLIKWPVQRQEHCWYMHCRCMYNNWSACQDVY